MVAKADVDVQLQNGDNPLVLAARKGSLEMVKSLVLAKAQIIRTNRKQQKVNVRPSPDTTANENTNENTNGGREEEGGSCESIVEIARKSYRKNNIAEWLTAHMAMKAIRRDIDNLWMLHPEIAEAITPCFDAKLEH
uniref:Uncharacterized protein n=1 Tax=Lotharella globosa TaxID=91324 RepID=A0A7S3Z1C4_9EUKA